MQNDKKETVGGIFWTGPTITSFMGVGIGKDVQHAEYKNVGLKRCIVRR